MFFALFGACHAGFRVLNPRATVKNLGREPYSVSASNQTSSVVSERYANALIELAEENKKLDKIEKDIHDLAAMIQDSDDLAQTIRSPLNKEQSLLNAMFALADKAKLQDVTKSFLGVLVQNGRLQALPGIIVSFKAALAKRRGSVSVDVQVAQDMTAKQKKDLEAALSKAIGKDVAVNARVEPGILGGMVVTVGSYMIDDSVRRKLERLQVSMGKQANENVTLKEVS